ncbi:MAG: YfbK domain-containing protein, partial [Candidatus Binatia bacterium]
MNEAKQDQDERLSSKGKTKEVGAQAGATPRAQTIGEESKDEATVRGGSPRLEAELPAAPPASTVQAPAPTANEAAQLRALSYLGGSTDSPPESQVLQFKRPTAQAVPEPASAKARGERAPAEGTVSVTSESPRLDDARRRASVEPAPKKAELEARQGSGQYVDAFGLEAPQLGAAARARPSTGGTREPNERVAGDMFFRPTETNPFVDTAEDRLSTFGLDVDTGSWSLARSYFDRGAAPPPEAIRVEEFVNAQSYSDPAPRRGDFTLVAEGAPSPFAPDESYRLLRFAVKARELGAGDRMAANLTFVVDVSGSMNRENRLGLVRRALGLLLSELGGDDRVALVVYGTRGRVVLRHTHDHEAIREAIASLRPEGSTNAEEGLRNGYDLAAEAWRRDAINRVILCSDGVANVGATGPESILERIGAEARRGIELTTVGFGMGNYNDALMEQLADRGDGAYHYVDSLEEARRIFVDELTGTLQTVAKDAKVQVEFDPRVVDRWRLLGYENRDVADRDFRNDRVDAGEIGAGHSVTAFYEVELKDGGKGPLATVRLRAKRPRGVEAAEQEIAFG